MLCDRKANRKVQQAALWIRILSDETKRSEESTGEKNADDENGRRIDEVRTRNISEVVWAFSKLDR